MNRFLLPSCALLLCVLSAPALTDEVPGSRCFPTSKGSVIWSPEMRDESTITHICGAEKMWVLESAKADPVRKGINTDDPRATLDINGGVKIGNDERSCAPELAGTLRWTGKNFEGCDGTSWLALGAAAAGGAQ